MSTLQPPKLYVPEMSFALTWMRFLYLAVGVDVDSARSGLGREGPHDRRPRAGSIEHGAGAVHAQWCLYYSDLDSQCINLAFEEPCRPPMTARPLMVTVGDANGNAMAESFFASQEGELIERNTFQSKVQARKAVFTWIEDWYNPRRRQSVLGYLSPEL